MTTERVEFPSGTGDTASGALAVPAGTGKAPAVLVIQEWWGINDQIKSVAERWAAEGFLALAVDLYRGALAKDRTQAAEMMNALDRDRALADIAGAVAYLRGHPRSTGKIGVNGYCMGGAYSFAAARHVRGLAAVVPFYGIPPGSDWSAVEAPIQAHFAARDDWAKPELAREIQKTLSTLGKPMELHVYEADHAFCNDRRPEVHDPEAAKLAWSRAVAFMKKHTA
jgi:carboxymethylenebutenolidase